MMRYLQLPFVLWHGESAVQAELGTAASQCLAALQRRPSVGRLQWVDVNTLNHWSL
jgi:hypothetical protein